MKIPFKVDVHISDDSSSCIEKAIIEIDSRSIERIKELSEVVKKYSLLHATEFDCTPDFYETDVDGELIDPYDSIENLQLKVGNGMFYWSGYIKHTDILIETDGIYLKKVEEYIEFYNGEAKKNAPLYINDKNYTKQQIALQIIKGEEQNG